MQATNLVNSIHFILCGYPGVNRDCLTRSEFVVSWAQVRARIEVASG